MSIRLVVFDLDGTLVDSSGDLATAVNAVLARIAPGTPPLPQALVRTLIGDGARSLVRRSLETAGVAAPTDDVLPLFLEAYRGCLLDTTWPYPGVTEALDALDGRVLAVLTNKPGDMSRAILDGLGLSSRFRSVYGGGDVPGKKPDPAGLLRLLAETGVPAAEAVLVGDSATDMRTGRAAGVGTVGVSYGFDPAGVRAVGADILIDDLRDLPARLD